MSVFTGNGSAAAPSYTFTASTTTGLFSTGANIAFSTNGIDRARFDTVGRLLFKVATNTPSTSGINAHIQLHGLSNDESTSALYDWQTSGTAGPFLVFSKARSGIVGNHTGGTVSSGGRLGYLMFGGSDGTAFREAASIQIAVDGAVAASSVPGTIRITTTPIGGSTALLRATFDSAGKFGLGKVPTASNSFVVAPLLTGNTTVLAVAAENSIASDVTSVVKGFVSVISTQNSSFTISNIHHFDADPAAKGASSTITTQFGFSVESSLTEATNNYGFWSGLAKATGRWGLYMDGDADNYIRGNVKLGGTADRATTAGDRILSIFNGTAPVGTLANGITFYSDAGEARVMDSAGNSTLLSPHDTETNEWIYDSTYTPTGKRLRIRMEAMMKSINDHFGWDFIEEFSEPA